MLALPSPPGFRPLSDFKGDGQAKVADFFAAWNADLPNELAEANTQICNKFIYVFGRTRFETWFTLKTTQVDTVISEIKGEDAGGTWRETIEALAGFRFERPFAPDSAALICKRSAPEEEKPSLRAVNVSARLLESGKLASQMLPQSCYDVIETVNPTENTITETELQRFTDSVVAVVAAKHGDWKLGAPLARVYGKQAKARLPKLPDRGTTFGHARKIDQMIFNKCKNRLYAEWRSQTRHPLPITTHASTSPTQPPRVYLYLCAEGEQLQEEAYR